MLLSNCRIPLTEMHRLFRAVRNLRQQDQLQFAERLVASPGQIRGCFERSVEQFEPYRNVDQSFHPGNRKANVQRTGVSFCLALASGYQFDAVPTLDFDFVDHEIVPSGTKPKTVFSDGSRAQNEPRVDALLVNHSDRLPIVAEVKVGNDKTTFVALLQALAGAVQLVTQAQRDRLQAQYPSAGFEFRVADGFADVYLFFVDPPTSGHARHWHRLRRCTTLLAKELAEGRILRRVELIDGVYNPPHCLELNASRVI